MQTDFQLNTKRKFENRVVVKKREIVEHESNEKSEYDIKYPSESAGEKRKG